MTVKAKITAAIRQNSIIKGIQVANIQHKISLYTDYLLLYIQNPQESVQETFNIVNRFSHVSHYTINWNKSILLPLSDDAWDSGAQDTSLHFHTGNIKYLGIHISPRLSELFTLNYTHLLRKIEDDYKRWSKHPLTLIGRIAAVKMKTLPQINYLFSMIPTTPIDNWFKTLNSLTTQFYWKYKNPRISLSTLQNKKSHGGLEAPNFHHYFLANQLQYLVKWINIQKHNYPWLELEQNQCTNISIADLPFLSQSRKKSNFCQRITINSTLTAWWKTNQITKSSLALNKYTPLWHNPMLTLQNKPFHFSTWAQKGITHLCHLFENNQFMSFNTLTQKYGIGREQFL